MLETKFAYFSDGTKSILLGSHSLDLKSHLDTNCSIIVIKKIIKSQILHRLSRIKFKIPENLLLKSMNL